MNHDPVNHPKHYTSHPSGVECIQITEHMDFCIGNAVKYLWRAGCKDSSPTIEDLKKAQWYIKRKIELLAWNGKRPPVAMCHHQDTVYLTKELHTNIIWCKLCGAWKNEGSSEWTLPKNTTT